MARASVRLNERAMDSLMRHPSKTYAINKGDGKAPSYKIGLSNGNDTVFEINLRKSGKDTYDFTTVSRMDKAKTVKGILDVLYLYKSFYDKSLKIDGKLLFGEILVGKTENLKFDGVEDNIRYWERIRQLEDKLNMEFQVRLPLSDSNAELLEELCVSLVDDAPVSMGRMNYIEIVPTKVEQVDDLLHRQGDFAVRMKCDGMKLLGCDLGNLYRVIFYSAIKVVGYEEIKSRHGRPSKFRLNVEEDEQSIAALKYFLNKEDAEKYLQEHSEDFKHAKKIWA